MSNKRSYSAFLSSAPVGATDTANGFDAFQPQAEQHTNHSSSHLHIPGAWPEDTSADDSAHDPTPASIFTTVGNWVSTISIAKLLDLPRCIATRFLQKQTVKAIPVVNSSGSNKRRFVAAGSGGNQVATLSPSVRARTHQARRQKQNRVFAPFVSSHISNYTVDPPRSGESIAPIQFTPQTHNTHVSAGYQASPSSTPEDEPSLDEDGDTSIDFSFDDILTSTPPRNPQTGSPVHVTWDSPQTPSSTSCVSTSQSRQSKPRLSPSCNSAQLNPSVNQGYQKLGSTRTKERAETTQSLGRSVHRTPKPPSGTSLRRQLVKLQFGAEHRRLQATRQAESLVQSTDQGFAEPEPTKITPTEAVDQDLSYLPDASSPPPHTEAQSKVDASSNNLDLGSAGDEFEYTNDLSFLLDAPPRPRVRWARHAGTKPFYCDEKVSDMLDSTLEIINSSPVRGVWHNFQYNDQSTSDRGHTSSSPHSSAADSPRAAAVGTQANDGGFHGVPPDTFDASDDSLEESALSLELVQDLQDDFKAKLALAPPPPPPPKPLITPLSAEELKTLYAAAANTSNGLKADKWVIDQKLYARDFATLLPQLFNGDPRAWLNDNIVNEYLSILVAAKKKQAGFEHKRGGPAPPVHAFSSFWYSTADTSRWSNRFQLKGKQYLDAQLILYPICDRGHWRLLAVFPQKRSIEYLDSMSLSGQKYIDKLDEYLKKELGDLYIADEWTKNTTQRSSQQLNGSDCGVFTLLNALTLLRGDDTKLVLATNGMDEARKRIAATLLAGHPTTELD